jgi:exosortase/archaeosortase family protein
MTAVLQAHPIDRTAIRRWTGVAVIVAAVICVFHTSLVDSYDALGSDDPLGWLAIVPLLAVGIGIQRAVVGDVALQVRALALDVMVAAPLAISSAMVMTFGARTHGAVFWAWRIDVVCMVVFTAAATIMTFGTETAWRMRAAFAYALLAWPVLWAQLLAWALPVLSQATSTITIKAASLLGLGARSGGDSILWVRHGESGFALAIAPLCAGSSTMTGWLLVGGAVSLTAHGHRRAKAAWLAVGAVAAFAANIARLVLLVAIGHFLGEGAAAQAHNWLGAVALATVVLAAILSMGRFGLSFRDTGQRRSWAPPRARPAEGRTAGMALAGLLAIIIVAGGPGITPAAALVGPLGEGRSIALSASAPQLANYSLASVEEIDWARQFFGRSSRWIRYRYDRVAGLDGPVAVTVDAQVNSDPDRFTRYSVDRCLQFHHHDPTHVRKVDMGFGLTGEAATWQEDSRLWQTLSWVLPVRVPDGTRRYERVLVSAEVPTSQQPMVTSAESEAAQQQALHVAEGVLDHLSRELLSGAVAAGGAS